MAVETLIQFELITVRIHECVDETNRFETITLCKYKESISTENLINSYIIFISSIDEYLI